MVKSKGKEPKADPTPFGALKFINGVKSYSYSTLGGKKAKTAGSRGSVGGDYKNSKSKSNNARDRGQTTTKKYQGPSRTRGR